MAKPLSNPGNTGPASINETAAIHSPTPTTRLSKAPDSHLAESFPSSSSMRARSSALTRSHGCSSPSTTPSTPRSEREKPTSRRLLPPGTHPVFHRCPTQIDETGQKCSDYKGQTPPRDGLTRGGSGDRDRSRWEGIPGTCFEFSVYHSEHQCH